MRKGPRNGRRDANEPEIISALESGGCTVQKLDGAGVPDLLIGFRHRNHIAEVKTETGKLNETQKEWNRRWQGDPPHLLRSVDDVERCLKMWSKRR